MKISVNSIAKYIFLFFVLLFNFLFLNNTIEPKLVFHAQQLSFVFSIDFLKQNLLLPGSLSEYLADFVSQLFYYNFWGSLVITIITVFIFFAGYYILKQVKINDICFFLALLPLIFIFPLFSNYYFPFNLLIKVLLIYCFSAIYTYSLKKDFYILPVYIILALLVYYVCGSGAFMIFSVNAIILTAYFKKLKPSAFFSLIVIALAIIVPYAAFKFIFNINLADAYFSILRDLPNAIKYKPDILLYFLFFYLPFSLIISAIVYTYYSNFTKKKETKELKPLAIFISNWGIIIISIILISSVNFFVIKQKFDNHNKNIVLADYYNYNEKWDEAKEIILSDNKYDMLLNFYYVRTISHLGEFIDSYFSYPQLLGGDALFPDRVESATTFMISTDYYYDLGYITQAHHWAHETQTSMPNSPRILRKLVMTNLIMGNYIAAKNLLSHLQKIPYNKDFVGKYLKYIEDTSLIVSDKEIMEKRALMPDKGAIVSDVFTQRLHNLLENRKNKDAYEHLQMYYLLNHQLGDFIKNMELGSQYFRTIPHVFEEAIFVYCLKTKQFPTNIKISKQVQNQILEISDAISQYNGDKYAAKNQLRSSYGNTYFYYLIYYSPMVTNAELRVK